MINTQPVEQEERQETQMEAWAGQDQVRDSVGAVLVILQRHPIFMARRLEPGEYDNVGMTALAMGEARINDLQLRFAAGAMTELEFVTEKERIRRTTARVEQGLLYSGIAGITGQQPGVGEGAKSSRCSRVLHPSQWMGRLPPGCTESRLQHTMYWAAQRQMQGPMDWAEFYAEAVAYGAEMDLYEREPKNAIIRDEVRAVLANLGMVESA